MLAALLWTLNRTKIGLLIRAGVQDREMVESLGYRIRRLFVGVFVAPMGVLVGVVPAAGGKPMQSRLLPAIHAALPAK